MTINRHLESPPPPPPPPPGSPNNWYHAARHLDTAATAEARDRSLEILAAASTLRPDATTTLVCPKETVLLWVRDDEHTAIRIDPEGIATPAYFGAAPDPHNLLHLGLGPTLLEQLQARLPGLELFGGFWGMSYRIGDGKFEGRGFRITLKDGFATLDLGEDPPATLPYPANVDRAGEYLLLEHLLTT